MKIELLQSKLQKRLSPNQRFSGIVAYVKDPYRTSIRVTPLNYKKAFEDSDIQALAAELPEDNQVILLSKFGNSGFQQYKNKNVIQDNNKTTPFR